MKSTFAKHRFKSIFLYIACIIITIINTLFFFAVIIKFLCLRIYGLYLFFKLDEFYNF